MSNETEERMQRVNAAIARQLSAAMADNIRLTQRLAKAVTIQPHEMSALHEVILNATAFAGLIGGPDGNKITACCNVVNQFIDRIEDRPLAMDEGAGDAMFSDATKHLRDEMGKLQAGAASPVDGKR